MERVIITSIADRYMTYRIVYTSTRRIYLFYGRVYSGYHEHYFGRGAGLGIFIRVCTRVTWVNFTFYSGLFTLAGFVRDYSRQRRGLSIARYTYARGNFGL